jgi:predicted  nucleic acid-binding Zn-ribbon protein
MSFWDRQIGAMDGSAATARKYEGAIDQWEAHSNRLEAKLRAAMQNAEELAKQKLFAQARIEGQTALVQALKQELERARPDSPLVREELARKEIQRTAIASFLKENGYDYDIKTQMVKKIG